MVYVLYEIFRHSLFVAKPVVLQVIDCIGIERLSTLLIRHVLSLKTIDEITSFSLSKCALSKLRQNKIAQEDREEELFRMNFVEYAGGLTHRTKWP